MSTCMYIYSNKELLGCPLNLKRKVRKLREKKQRKEKRKEGRKDRTP